MISTLILFIRFLKESELLFFLEINVFTYFYLIRIILFIIDHLFTYS